MNDNQWKEVSKEEFFKALYADKRDIMPVVSGDYNREACGYLTVWQCWPRIVFGKSLGSGPKSKWWLVMS